MINVLEWLEHTASVYPDNIAFADPVDDITFSALCSRAKQTGSLLLGRNIKPGSAVVFYMEKSVKAVTVMLGGRYANAFYSFIDTRQTANRAKAIIDVLEPFVIVTDTENEEAVRAIADGETDIVNIDDLLDEAMSAPVDEDLLAAARSEFYDTQILYVNFTSGSTGVPKGVAVCHRSVIDFIEQFTSIFGIDDTDVIANQAPFDFDVSVKDFYSGLMTGARVQLIPRGYFTNPTVLVDYISDCGATTLIWAVSAMCFVSIMNCFDYRLPDRIRRVMFSGEIMPVKQLLKWQSYIPDAMYVNLYGPTEITCNCTYYILDRQFEKDEIIPIGIPFPNEKVFLLDDEDNTVTKPGIEGEICVAGTCLALGYYKDPEKTAASFTQNPVNTALPEIIYRTGDLGRICEDGNLIYTSRKDHQIKHMGQRIELGDIEVAAMSSEGVSRACCIYDHDRKKIILFYTGEAEKEMLTEDIKDRLPSFMIPQKTVRLEEFPMNKNGKIDRTKLKEMK